MPDLHNLNPKQYSAMIYEKTKKYQKIYGFQLGSGKYDTWNNEADAFKHTFMQADLALKYGSYISKSLGDFHEEQGQKNHQDPREENMDRWNNEIGRKIGQEIAEEINNPVMTKYYAHSEQLDDMIAKKVMQRMRKGDLITNPFTDKRKYKEKPTGYAADIEPNFVEFKGYDPQAVISDEEISELPQEEFQKHKDYIVQQLSQGLILPQNEIQQKYQNGELVWVNAYVRHDGTHVDGYYRSRPHNY